MSTYVLSTAHIPRRAYDISHLNVLLSNLVSGGFFNPQPLLMHR